MIRRVQSICHVAHSVLKMLPIYAGGAGSSVHPQLANEIDQQNRAGGCLGGGLAMQLRQYSTAIRLTRRLSLSGVVGGEGGGAFVGLQEQQDTHRHRRILKKATGMKRKSPRECVGWGPKKKLFLFFRD
jgi:hypothetical protein